LATVEHFELIANSCRQQYRNGGTCIFVHEYINCDIIPTDHICKDKDLEICAIKLDLYKTNIVIIANYRSHFGDYNYSYFL